MSRIVSWFSCGVASAVATKLAIKEYGPEVVPVYCDTSINEETDNMRFFNDVQDWIGVKIHKIKSAKYDTVEEVFEARKYMSGIAGAPCTVELKKVPRFEFQQPDDLHIFGYRLDERKRMIAFEKANPELRVSWILYDKGYDRSRCNVELLLAHIQQPVLYSKGYDHNNCLGCVKASSPHYWNKVRNDYPEVFANRSEQSRRLGCKLTRAKIDGKWQRIYLDELPRTEITEFAEDLSCGPECKG